MHFVGKFNEDSFKEKSWTRHWWW